VLIASWVAGVIFGLTLIGGLLWIAAICALKGQVGVLSARLVQRIFWS
jgi:hypothetical protein